MSLLLLCVVTLGPLVLGDLTSRSISERMRNLHSEFRSLPAPAMVVFERDTVALVEVLHRVSGTDSMTKAPTLILGGNWLMTKRAHDLSTLSGLVGMVEPRGLISDGAFSVRLVLRPSPNPENRIGVLLLAPEGIVIELFGEGPVR